MWTLPFLTRRTKREIFKYHDGVRPRAGDPIQISRALDTDPEYRGDLHPEAIDAGDMEAVEIMCAAIRRAFDVLEWTEDQPGLTVAETLTLHAMFSDYVAGIKKNTRLLPTSQEPSESTLPRSSEPTTNGSPPSTMPVPESTCDMPTT